MGSACTGYGQVAWLLTERSKTLYDSSFFSKYPPNCISVKLTDKDSCKIALRVNDSENRSIIEIHRVRMRTRRDTLSSCTSQNIYHCG